jgi:O-antigen ligase
MDLTKDKGFKINISLIPFILLLSIGLIEGDKTVYQKVFKTYMIFIFDIELLVIFALYVFVEKVRLKYIFIFIAAVSFGVLQNILFYMQDNILINFFILSVVIVVSFYLLSVNANAKKSEALIKDKKYVLFFILYFLFILIQYLVSFVSKEVSYDRNYHFSNYIMLLIFAMSFYLLINDLEEIKTGLLLIDVFLVIVLIWSTTEFIQTAMASYKNNSVVFNLGTILSQFRPKLSFGNTDYFSGYMVGILPLAIVTPFVFYSYADKFRKKFLTISSAVVAFLGFVPLVFSQTVSAIGGIIIGLVILVFSILFMQVNLKLKYKMMVMTAIVAFLIIFAGTVLFVPNPISKNVMPRLIAKASNPLFALNDRFNAWSCGLNLFKDHPVFGSGLGTVYAASFKYMNKYFYIYSDSNSFKHSHNEFLEVLGEGGIFGLIFFVALFGFILFSLFKRAYSRKYEFNYRLVCLGVSVGIISMLIHQVFSLSLRMSVTMTMYFFLIGMGIFLISYSKKALLDGDDAADGESTAFKGPFTQRQFAVLTAVLSAFLLFSLFLFLPVYMCENNIVKVLPLSVQRPLNETDYYLKKAISFMPGNPYAWTYKFSFDSEIKMYDAANNSKSYEEYYQKRESIFDDTIGDLDRINSIIPGYQDVWQKYGQTYFSMCLYMKEKFGKTGRSSDLDNAGKYMEKALFYFNKSLDMDFLDRDSHLKKLFILKQMDNKNQFKESLANLVAARIYVDYARGRRILKDDIKIDFSDTDATALKVEKNKYYFTLNKNDLDLIAERDYLIDDANNLSNTINEDTTRLFGSFKNDNLEKPVDDNINKTTTE